MLKLTKESFTENGYFITGDIGYIKDNKLTCDIYLNKVEDITNIIMKWLKKILNKFKF